MAKARTNQERSSDAASIVMLERAEALGITTAFQRAEQLAACPIGAGQSGTCCKVCYMGPCRITKDGQVGVCGATMETINARNMARACAGGAAAHSDHGRDLAFTLLATAEGKAQGYEIRDVARLWNVAKKYGISTEGRSKTEVAKELALKGIAMFGQQQGETVYIQHAPEKRQKIWRQQGVVPRGVDREVVDILHRTHMGDDQDPEHILQGAIRTSLADGWGGSMLATDFSDILFGTPSPNVSQVSLGVLKKDEVNILVHGHEPTLSEMIVAACQDPAMQEYAKSRGAKGVNLAGICCTSNEILIRQGIPSAGNFLNQELALVTGAVDEMIVDVQCIMQALPEVASRFHTKIVTTSPKVKITGATHVEFDEHKALDQARALVKMAIDNYANRGEVMIPDQQSDLVPGFSHEYINYMLGGTFRASFRPLNDAIMSGRIRGVVADVGCNNARTTQDASHNFLVRELLKNDVLVVETGCAALASAKMGYLLGDAAMEYAGPGLREVCEAVGIPPVLHAGSCVDNTRILTVLTQMVQEGGLGDDISDIPAVGLAPEWMSEKAISIGMYCVASGAYVIFGTTSPIASDDVVQKLMTEGWEEKFGGKMEFITDEQEILRKTLEHIDKKRAALKLPAWEPARHGKSGDSRMEELVSLPLEERLEALYGTPVTA
jgi:carbon-monoxide dehydrogenase catalytic subunit